MKRQFLLFTLFLFLTNYSWCQTDYIFTKDSIIKNIIDQIILFPKEKLYIHVDKSIYVAGEKIWFRAWVVDAVLHKPLSNQYLYVELINPLDSIVSKVIIRQNQGSLNGFLPLNLNLPEGDYTLCAYTESLKNLGQEFIFKKTITVVSPYSATIKPEIKFKFETDDKLVAEIYITDINTRKKILSESLKISVNMQPLKVLKIGNDSTFLYPFKLPKKENKRVLFLETQNDSRYFSIPYPYDDFDVSFYPEGGYLLQDVNCRVAFKALSSSGTSENVTGKIVDNNDNEIVKLVTTYDGMGMFSLSSKEGLNYYAVCKNGKGKEKRFELPRSQKELYALKVEATQGKLFVTVLQSLDKIKPGPLFLLLHTRGIVHYASQWDQNYSTISFNTDKFPTGVMQIILFDNKMNPISERLVFCNNNDQAHVDIITDHSNYNSRQPVKAQVKIANFKGVPQEGAFSVSITDDKDIKYDSTITIMTSLLLSSELKGYINNPAFYFQKNNPEVEQSLDLLMLINGWRRYNIPKIIKGEFEKPSSIVNQGLAITGKVRSLISNKPVKKGKVSILSWNAGYYQETETDSTGKFSFNEIEFPDSTTFVIQALNKNESNRCDLVLDSFNFPELSTIPNTVSLEKDKEKESEQTIKYITKADTKYSLDNGIKMINLREVLVTAKAPPKNDYSYSFYMPPSISGINVLTKENVEFSHYKSVSDILVNIPFVRIVEDNNSQKIEGINTQKKKVIIERMKYHLNREEETLYAALILDDVIIQDYDIDMIDPATIERIGVLKGAQASILGGEGAGGAIVITTKKSDYSKYDSPKYNIKKVSPLGYQKPVEFYSPCYETSKQRDNGQPDLRTTIYWNPNVVVSSLGESAFDFYTADASTTYTVVIEGITSDGSIIYGLNKISRK